MRRPHGPKTHHGAREKGKAGVAAGNTGRRPGSAEEPLGGLDGHHTPQPEPKVSGVGAGSDSLTPLVRDLNPPLGQDDQPPPGDAPGLPLSDMTAGELPLPLVTVELHGLLQELTSGDGQPRL